jgi:hypothetical protein
MVIAGARGRAQAAPALVDPHPFDRRGRRLRRECSSRPRRGAIDGEYKSDTLQTVTRSCDGVRPMKVRVNRDSVCAGDDVEAHDLVLDLPAAETLAALVASVLRSYELPQIHGGKATWCLSSRRPIAVVAQQWPSPRMVPWQARPVSDCKIVDGVVRLHFSYLVQIDPDVAYEVLRSLHLED